MDGRRLARVVAFTVAPATTLILAWGFLGLMLVIQHGNGMTNSSSEWLAVFLAGPVLGTLALPAYVYVNWTLVRARDLRTGTRQVVRVGLAFGCAAALLGSILMFSFPPLGPTSVVSLILAVLTLMRFERPPGGAALLDAGP